MQRWRVQPGAPKLEIEQRADGDEGEMPTSFRGYATIYNSRTTVFWGEWYETVETGAFDASIAADTDRIATLWQHDSREPLGRVSAGTMRVWSDDVGVGYSCTPHESNAHRLASIARGDVHQSSIGFDAIETSWDWMEDEELWRCTIHEGGMWEGSPVTWPAVLDAWVSVRGKPEFRGVERPALPAELSWEEEAGRMTIRRQVQSAGVDLAGLVSATRAKRNLARALAM